MRKDREMEFICTRTEPVVETKAGKVRGYKMDGVYTFKGIRYATAKRFHQPVPVEPFEGIADATQYGDTAPYMEKKINGFGDIRINHRYWPQDEDCLFLNVFTDTINDESVKRPVLFWIHGGGFDTGSSVELVCYEGGNIAKTGEAVLVSINHRLNICGYTDLSAYGEEYRYSGTAGIADIVVALQWVKDNISRFGGDPDNVTIFGQSGGGGKVRVLLQTPAADGLFHRAVIQSGYIMGADERTQEKARAVSARLIEKLGITSDRIKEIEEIPFEQLRDAYNAIKPELIKEGLASRGFAPVPNGYYVGYGVDVGFTAHARTVPVLIGCTLGEIPVRDFPGRTGKTEAEKEECVRARYGEKAGRMMELFRKAYPDHDIMDLFFLDTLFRKPNLQGLDTFSADPNAKCYSYLFAYDFPLNDREPAWHCSELPFVFRNIDSVPVCHEPEVGERLQEQFFNAWLAFAKTGDPNNSFLPEWRPYGEAHQTMVFDRTCRLSESDYDRELIDLALT